jgi:hypothetical protein
MARPVCKSFLRSRLSSLRQYIRSLGCAQTKMEIRPPAFIKLTVSSTLAGAVFGVLLIYSARLTSIVFCATNGQHPLLIAGAAFFPVGVVHGIGGW